MNANASLFEHITRRVITLLKAGVPVWRQPWAMSPPRNGVSKRTYHGINSLILAVEQHDRNYESSEWLTFPQAKQLGGHVRHGERATRIVWWKLLGAPEQYAPRDQDERDKGFWVARTACVFNIAQTNGIPSLPRVQSLSNAPSDGFDEVTRSYGAEIRHGGSRAYYEPERDYIQIPPRRSFDSPESFYATLAHELIHHTGAPHRLNRDLTGRFGSNSYALEELVAELGGAFLTARVGMLCPMIPAASYMDAWLQVLGKDASILASIASMAQRAVDYIAPPNLPQDTASVADQMR